MKAKYNVVFFLFLFTSCNFLEIEPKTFVPLENFYETEEQMEQAITAVYDVLGKSHLYRYGQVVLFATEADEGFYASSGQVNGPSVYNINPSTADVKTLWSQLYEGIDRANVVLKYIDKPKMNDEKRAKIKGEALFLRAYFYFMLVQYWQDVPVKLTPSDDFGELAFDRPATPMKDVYTLITTDMEESEKMVPGITELGYSGRVNKSAVRAILARVYLHWAGYPLKNTEKYEDVIYWSKMLIDDPVHVLNPSYSDVFKNMAQDQYDIAESIFEVEFSSHGAGNIELGLIGSYIGITNNNPTIGAAYGFIATQPRLYKLYDEGDLRRDRVIANFSYPSAASTAVTFHSASTIYGRKVGKWRRSEETSLPKLAQFTPTNFPIIRYSDVLLMYAEALNNTQPGADAPQDAIDAVNEVRMRAWATGVKNIQVVNGGSGYTSAPVVTISGGGGVGAVATAVVANGIVTSISFPQDELTGYKMGTGYASIPIVTLSGGGGSGAKAIAQIHKKEDGKIGAMSKEKFKELIMAERSRELCFEGLRKFDLIRWNIFIETLKDVKAEIDAFAPANYKYASLAFTNVEEKHRRLPYPAAELALNKALKQITGY
ncbi:RagB/SusD family nutrient uptake outer membrane protein [Sphingobacterium tabacisoli]|uniref:RagB/SusD family nutrient uptake outer membrane protein n=1 Tax=Sphingobacterium tabacisoli TaxID=2044855 RepID=A0ABW5L4L5_9SPHI|nr:RagB/SusD family nutrient uptake outer membrane protein [Sphingobacterium tabacisoli]